MATTKVFIGLDLGSSRIKAMAQSERGETGLASRPTPWQGVQLDPELVSQVALGVCHESVDCFGNSAEVAAIGVTSMAESGIWVDAEGPLAPLTSWQDESRTQDLYRRFAQNFDLMEIYKRTGVVASPKFSLFRAMIDAGTRPASARTWFQLADWIIYRWTRGACVSHANLAARTMAMNWRTAKWDDDLLSYAGLSAQNFPEIVTTPVSAGRIRLDSASPLDGVPVVHAGMDHAAAYLGANLPLGVALDSSGTAEPWVVEEAQPILTQTALEAGMVWAPNITASGYSGLLPTPAGGAAERWARRLFGEGAIDDEARPLPEFEAQGFMRSQARLLQVGPATEPADFYQAVLVGVAQSLNQRLDDLRCITGRAMQDVAFVGGAVSHQSWSDLRQKTISANLWALSRAEIGAEATALGAIQAARMAMAEPLRGGDNVWRNLTTNQIATPPWLLPAGENTVHSQNHQWETGGI